MSREPLDELQHRADELRAAIEQYDAWPERARRGIRFHTVTLALEDAWAAFNVAHERARIAPMRENTHN